MVKYQSLALLNITGTYHLKQGQVCMTNMVKCYFGVHPGVIFSRTLPLVLDNINSQSNIVIIQTFVKFSSKKLDTHDREDEPEDQTHKKHIENGWYGVHQSVHYNLQNSDNLRMTKFNFLHEYKLIIGELF